MERERAWRVGHQGRDQMYYEERDGATWRRLEMDGEMLTGRAHHVIYFASPARWQAYPAWAHGRRDEIIARVMSAFQAPDYEYDWGGDTAAPPPPDTDAGARTPQRSSRASHLAAAPAMTASQRRAMILAIGLLLCVAAGMGWLVARGVRSGVTVWPGARPSQQRSVQRTDEPATYWATIGIYAVLGAGALGLAGAGVAWSRRA